MRGRSLNARKGTERTHLMRRSPSALGDEGLLPMSFNLYRRSQRGPVGLNGGHTESNDRLALYTLSTLRNIVSSSLGGRFDLDQAAATF